MNTCDVIAHKRGIEPSAIHDISPFKSELPPVSLTVSIIRQLNVFTVKRRLKVWTDLERQA